MVMSFFICRYINDIYIIAAYQFCSNLVGLLYVSRGKCLFKYGLGAAFTRQY